MTEREPGKAGAGQILRATTRVNDLNIFYLDTGSAGESMICLHGRWGRAQTWTDLMLRYRNKYRIVAPDQRGHGLSDKPVTRYASEDLAADAYGLMKNLELGKTIVVGHSMGGRIAAHVAAANPEHVRALVILDEPASGPEEIPDLAPEDIPLDDKLTSEWPAYYSTYAEALKDLRSRFERETNVMYFLESLVETPEGYCFLFSRAAMSALGAYHQGWYNLLPDIKCPVLLVRASDSWCLPAEDAEKMRTIIKDCTYFEVDDSDHMVYADNPEAFYPQFESFLDRVGSGSA